jgi:lysophospholipase L1-like esterase
MAQPTKRSGKNHYSHFVTHPNKVCFLLGFVLLVFVALGCRVIALSSYPPAASPAKPSATSLSTHTPTSPLPTAALTPTLTIVQPSATATVTETATPSPTPEPTETNIPQPWRIMPLGDSLTSGNYPGRVHSYRGYLESLLRQAGYGFDYVGTESRPAHGGTDPDNEGHSGFTIGPDEARFCTECSTANLYDHLEDYLQTEPDIILLLIGINDLIPLDVRPVIPEEAPAKLAGLVQRIQVLRPETYIFLASLPPVQFRDSSQWPPYQAINQMAEQIATADAGDRIYFVDINRTLTQNLDPGVDFADGIHLAEGGARKMAQVWLDAMIASGLPLARDR